MWWQSGNGSLTKEEFLLIMKKLDPSVDDKVMAQKPGCMLHECW